MPNDVSDDQPVHNDQTAPTGTRSSWVALTALVVALIAVAVAIWALVNPASAEASDSEHSAATAQESEGAKARACDAFHTVRNAVIVQTNQDLGPDPIARKAVAADARLATLGGGQYLLGRVDSATPPELADAIRSFANNLQEVGMSQLAGSPSNDPTQQARLSDADKASALATEMCK